MKTASRAFILGLAVAVAGVAVNSLPTTQAIEEEIGLSWLFRLRGPRPAPPDVLVVSVDQVSSHALGRPNDPRKWPRSLHAQLVDSLTELGASSIAFDIIFAEPKSPREDQLFAASMKASNRVILFAYLIREPLSVGNIDNQLKSAVHVERIMPPIPMFAEAARALAPFPLPKVPAKVSQAWVFKRGAGDVPTLPAVSFQLHMEPYLREFCELLLIEYESLQMCQPRSRTEFESPANTLSAFRELFKSEPHLEERILARIVRESDPGLRSALTRLLRFYTGPNSYFLDFYGPARSISTVAYHRLLEPDPTLRELVKDKAVFVGFAEQFQPEQKDGFYTVFSRLDGLDISGVEIAATTLANLMEGRHIQPLRIREQYATLTLWGLIVGAALVSVPGVGSIALAFGLAATWLFAALSLFTHQGLWLPLAVPLLFQLPSALVGGLLWRYIAAKSERQRMRKVFAHFVPPHVVDDLAQPSQDIAHKVDTVQGVCLATDVDQFTKVAEKLRPDELRDLLNRYFEIVFRPIRDFGGTVTDVIGDAIMAVWTMGESDDPDIRGKACLAALAINQAVEAFNRRYPDSQLPTRIGLHSGRIAIGNVGAGDHFEYRPIGDIVNASSRVEGLNKHLGTRVLATQAVVDGLGGLAVRDLGNFRVVGRQTPLTIYELIGRKGEVDQKREQLCVAFEEALQLFRNQSWHEASGRLQGLLQDFGEDGPSRYYLKLADQYAEVSPAPTWDGVINMSNK